MKQNPRFMIQDTRYRIHEKGFTLIELLVVIAIIGILSSAVLVGLTNVRKQGRDARRIADLRQVQNALELYFQKNGYYPKQTTWSGLKTDLMGAGLNIYEIPTDPTSGWSYGYCNSNGELYVIGAYLEDLNNPALKQYETNLSTQICNPALTGTPSDPNCTTKSSVTNKYCLTL